MLTRSIVFTPFLFAVILPGLTPAEEPTREEMIRTAVAQLVKMQEDGAWPYEGVYRVDGKIPIGYRVGGTSLAAQALLAAAPKDREVLQALSKALGFVLGELGDPLMEASIKDGYDVRVWGHACALEFLCQVRAASAEGESAKKVMEWIPKLVASLITEEVPGGGWNYASRHRQASFVTAPVTQALLLARAQGEKVPDDLLDRARKVLEEAKNKDGAFVYSGDKSNDSASGRPAGACARTAACETTLVLLGGGGTDAVQAALDSFHKNWDELEKRRKKTGTHEGDFLIAPYYFYYGHRYAAQAIELLPEKARAAEREKLKKVILKTRDDDGTWNDRAFARSRNYGTAMVLMALLAERMPLPPRYEKK